MSTTSDAPAATAKLIWNSPIDSEETFEAVTAGLKTSLIKGRVWHCVSESESTASLTTRPSRLQAGRKGYDTRLAAWEKSLRELNGDANEAMGTLMSLFNPECNAHRSLSDWFAEDVTSMLAPDYKNRRDYNFRHAWTKFYAEYQPNKEVNLDTILKKWEALTDEDHSFAEFYGKYTKLISEMEIIGQPPTEAKRYEMLRNNVKNPYLSHIVVKLSLPESRRIPLDVFFEDCNYFTRFNKTKDTGHKRKVEEIFGRAVTFVKPTRDPAIGSTCWRCGRGGHLKFNYLTKLACNSTLCSLCRKPIGNDPHDARSCCERSDTVFPEDQQPAKKKQKTTNYGGGASPNPRKKGKPDMKNKKPSTSTSQDAMMSVPKDVVSAMRVLSMHFAGDRAARSVTFPEESDTSR
jgi:hypothetical protein